MVSCRYLGYLLYTVNRGDAYAPDHAVNEHFARSALAYTALQAPVAVVKAVRMDRITRLVQCSSYSKTLHPFHHGSVIFKAGLLVTGNIKYRML